MIIRVKKSSRRRLDLLLQEHGYQPWRLKTLLKCGAIKLLRTKGREHLLILEEKDYMLRLQSGDVIRIELPLSPKCKDAFDTIPVDQFWDYAFVPLFGVPVFEDSHVFLEFWEEILDKRRPRTKVIQDPYPSNIKQFIEAITKSDKITQPIRDLIIVSHASAEGDLFIDLDTLYKGLVTYDSLKRAGRTVRIPLNAVTPRPKEAGRELPLGVHIKGCNIGKVVQFLGALWEALGGGNLVVTAPKHYHVLGKHRSGFFFAEYFKYRFKVKSPKPFETVEQLIKAFRSERFRLWPFEEGSTVPDTYWDNWIPKKHLKKKQLAPPPKKPYKKEEKIKAPNPISNLLLTVKRDFLAYRRTLYTYPGSFLTHVKSDPGTKKKREQAVKEYFAEKYKDSKFPIYLEYEYASWEEFMDGWEWQIEWTTHGYASGLLVQATRYEYEVRQPIVEPGTNELFMNQYSRHRRFETKILVKEDNDKFFGQYSHDALEESNN